MIKLIIVFLFFLVSCSNNNRVYWCGDHACINKKEKEAYFKEYMIIEVRELNKQDVKENSEIKKIREKAILKEKKRIKQEKELAKLAKREKKQRIKKEKKLAKLKKIEKKKAIKTQKKLSKLPDSKKAKVPENAISNVVVTNNDFNSALDQIIEKNKLRPFPDINDIPN